MIWKKKKHHNFLFILQPSAFNLHPSLTSLLYSSVSQWNIVLINYVLQVWTTIPIIKSLILENPLHYLAWFERNHACQSAKWLVMFIICFIFKASPTVELFHEWHSWTNSGSSCWLFRWPLVGNLTRNWPGHSECFMWMEVDRLKWKDKASLTLM